MLPPDDVRLVEEGRFMCSLASPSNLHYLAVNGYLSDPVFFRFLHYLQYWKDPKYAELVPYSAAFFYLDCILASRDFRDRLKLPEVIAKLEAEQARTEKEPVRAYM